MFKYEMHSHTSAVSLCARSSPSEMVQAYYDAGFSGIVFTDHFIYGNTAVDKTLPWAERMDLYFNPYEDAKKLGEELGISVFVGIEHAYGHGKEVLVYGDLTAEAFSANPEIAKMDIHEFADFCHKNGWFIAHAHPFRDRSYINLDVPPVIDCVDGIEVYNHGNSPEENFKAVELCEANGLIPISGSVSHIVNNCGMAGVAFDEKITSSKDLVKALFERKARLIVNGEII